MPTFAFSTLAALVEAGAIPRDCTRFEMVAEAGKPVVLRYEVLASEEQVRQIAEALERNPEEARRMARAVLFRGRGAAAAVSVEWPGET